MLARRPAEPAERPQAWHEDDSDTDTVEVLHITHCRGHGQYPEPLWSSMRLSHGVCRAAVATEQHHGLSARGQHGVMRIPQCKKAHEGNAQPTEC